MNDMIVKRVDLMGDTIMAAKDSEGNIWAGVNFFCKALGMSKGQRDRQVQNVQTDETLKRGASKLEAGVFDENNETVVLKIEYVPLWLTKITITEKTKEAHPELAEKLLQYQLKAKDILAEAFMPKQNAMPQTTDGKIALLAQGHVELKEEIDSVKADLEALKMDLPILPVEADRITEAARKKGVSVLGGKSAPAYRNRGLRQKVYNNLYANLKYNFSVRSYKAIKRSQCDKAVEIINFYQPPFFLAEQIENENAQQRLEF